MDEWIRRPRRCEALSPLRRQTPLSPRFLDLHRSREFEIQNLSDGISAASPRSHRNTGSAHRTRTCTDSSTLAATRYRSYHSSYSRGDRDPRRILAGRLLSLLFDDIGTQWQPSAIVRHQVPQ
jgi:hypothetical protein